MEPEAPDAPPPIGAPAAPRRRRRRRGRRGPGAPTDGPPTEPARREEPRGPEERERRRRRRQGREARGERSPAPAPTSAALVPSVSRLAAEPAAPSEPLAPAEIAEMKEHLVFLREYKDVLRLRLNAAEDLLVNGRREPSDRGTCRHLLGKVDRAVVEAALAREPLKSNLPARARMLAGAIRLTADVGVLLAYLETLAPRRSHAEAAAAFAEVVRRIDFESLSATRLARLLQVLTETFEGQERVQVLFGLLDGDAFRRAFDAAAAALPADVAAVFAPLRAVHRRLRGEPEPATGRADAPDADASVLAIGLEQVMAAPDPVLRGYPEPLRIRLLELALDPGIPPALADRAAGVLLGSLAHAGKTFVRLGMRRAVDLLARHVDDRARATLEAVRRAAPGQHAAERWLAALAARRMGRVALVSPPPERGRLAAGFWLDGQRPVWLRTAAADDAARLAREAEVQAALALPGVAPLVEHGVAIGLPYVAVAAPGHPWRLDEPRGEQAAAAALVTQAARILRALALAAVALPDAEPERFCLGNERAPSLVLADLDGARATTPADAERANAAAAAALAARVVPGASSGPDLATLVRDLDRLVLGPRRDA